MCEEGRLKTKQVFRRPFKYIWSDNKGLGQIEIAWALSENSQYNQHRRCTVCLFAEFDGFPPMSALRFYIYFFPYFLYNLGLTLFEEVV